MNKIIEKTKQATGQAARTVAHKSRKPRVQVDVGLVFIIALTVLSMLPYELGKVATFIPVEWKPFITLIGTIAGTILGVMRVYMPSSNAPNPPINPPQQQP